MTTLGRLHDRIHRTEGIECRCAEWGTGWCPAMKAARAQHKLEASPGPQLELGDQTAARPIQNNDDWGGY